jgi:sulfatase modifying factor 1
MRTIRKCHRPLFISLFVFILSANSAMATPATIENKTGMNFVLVPAGEFVMGLADRDEALMEVIEPKDNELMDELPAHRVVISKPFYMGRTEVTQQQWKKIMENQPGPEAFWNRKDWTSLPVVSVSWFMANRFVEELNKIDTEYKYRLPTEAEWEYVARAGSNELRPFSEDELNEQAWFIGSSGDVVHPVATRKANVFGVYDMLGNVWEWVDNWYAADAYKNAKLKNPSGPIDGFSKVRRGGSYHCPLHMTRPGYRSANKPGTRYEVVGFRVVAETK